MTHLECVRIDLSELIKNGVNPPAEQKTRGQGSQCCHGLKNFQPWAIDKNYGSTPNDPPYDHAQNFAWRPLVLLAKILVACLATRNLGKRNAKYQGQCVFKCN